MSTNPTTKTTNTTEPQLTTDIAARGRTDPWAAADTEAVVPPSSRTQRQFEPTARGRLRNLADDENAYCG